MSRRNISAAMRFSIMRRDGFRCRYCGRLAAHIEMALDHVIPFSQGGACDESNLVTACIECNAGKSATQLSPEEVAFVLPPEEHVLREIYQTALNRFPSFSEKYDSKVFLMFMLRDAEMNGVKLHELRRAVERCEDTSAFLTMMSALSPAWASFATSQGLKYESPTQEATH